MQTIVDFFTPPPELLILLGLGFGGLIVLMTMAARAAARAATPENAKKIAVGTAKIAGKTAGKIAGKAAWQAFKSRARM